MLYTYNWLVIGWLGWGCVVMLTDGPVLDLDLGFWFFLAGAGPGSAQKGGTESTLLYLPYPPTTELYITPETTPIKNPNQSSSSLLSALL